MKANSRRISFGVRFLLIASCVTLSAFAWPGSTRADDIYPPSFLSAISGQDGQVPLLWFSPHPDTHNLASHGDQMLSGMHVVLPWRDNCVAARMNSASATLHLLKSKFYVPHQGADGDPDYDFGASFFVTVNADSGGIPQNRFLDSVSCSATAEDSLSEGEWVDVEHNLLLRDSVFWIVFHWQEDSPLSPLVAQDDLANTGHSFWGKRTFHHFEWHPTAHNLMIQAEIATNGHLSSGVDSFQIYRSQNPDTLVYQSNLIAAVPGLQFGHTDSNVAADETYFYRVTCLDSSGESRASNLAQATPRNKAALDTDRDGFSVHTSAGQPVSESLQLTNSGGLPLEFRAQLGEQHTDRIGGSDPYGYIWTDNTLDSQSDFCWVAIEERGIRVGQAGDDNEDYGFFELGFSFSFYEDTFDSLRISSDGWLSFSHLLPCYSDTFKCYVNQQLPWLWGPYYLLATFWDDLKLVDSSAIFLFSNADSAVISFLNVHRYGQAGGGPYTFQAILTPDGQITFQYLRVPDSIYSATVGTQNRDGTVGLKVMHNEHSLHDSLAIMIKPGWVKVDSRKGWLQPGESKTLSLTFDPLCYPQGIYHVELLIHSWDENHQLEDKVIPLTFCIDTTTSVEWTEAATPEAVTLLQNYPNPFNPFTSIEFVLFEPGWVKLEIINLLGQKVRTLLDKKLTAGQQLVPWDGRDDSGKEVSSGIYLYRIRTAGYSAARKMLLLK